MTEREIPMVPYGPSREYVMEFGACAVSYWRIRGRIIRIAHYTLRNRRRLIYLGPKLVRRYQRGMLWMRWV